MNGQMSLFDFIQDPDQGQRENAEKWSARKPSDKAAEQARVARTCKSCKHFFCYTAGISVLFHGTACGKNRPLSTNTDPDKPACRDWIRKQDGETG